MFDLRLSHFLTKWAIYPSWLFKKSIERGDISWIPDRDNNISVTRWSGPNAFWIGIVPDSMPIASIACSGLSNL